MGAKLTPTDRRLDYLIIKTFICVNRKKVYFFGWIFKEKVVPFSHKDNREGAIRL